MLQKQAIVFVVEPPISMSGKPKNTNKHAESLKAGDCPGDGASVLHSYKTEHCIK